MESKTNTEFEILGINHLALMCRDMKETVDFYNGVLGMPLTATAGIGGTAQIFFFDIGNGTHLAFMYVPDAPPAAPGIASPAVFLEDQGRSRTPGATTWTAVGSMNHVAMNIPLEKVDEYREKLVAKGIEVNTRVLNSSMDKSGRAGSAEDPDDPAVFLRSIYFHDPNGIQLEFAAWTRAMTPEEASAAPSSAADLPSRDNALTGA